MGISTGSTHKARSWDELCHDLMRIGSARRSNHLREREASRVTGTFKDRTTEFVGHEDR